VPQDYRGNDVRIHDSLGGATRTTNVSKERPLHCLG
jgi:hypothetical protein